ncbi:MAG: hypothetical protein PHU97_10130 [Bacteroidales bacterium]|nr:hypothetical protein [Bacteroidales bacterium]MDD3960516.1 hypothetical protein [Bacteroidales bacterium]
MRPSTKNIDFNYKQTLVSNRVNLIPNDCFGNIVRSVDYDNSKKLVIGYVYDLSLNLYSLHGWIESEYEIFEISLPKGANKIQYFKIFDIKAHTLKKLLSSDYPTIESLIGHRYYSLDFIKAQNHFSSKGSLFATAHGPQSQGCATFNSKIELIMAYLGLFEYKLKTWVKPSF